MNSYSSEVLLLLALVLLNAFFAGSEAAFLSLREGQLQRLEERGGRGQLAAQMARNPWRFHSTIQVFLTFTSLLASAIAAVSFADPLHDQLRGQIEGASTGVAVLIVTIVLGIVMVTLGELTPKRIASQHAEGWALMAIRPMLFFATLAGPFVWLLDHITASVVRFTGGDPTKEPDDATEEDLRATLQTQEGFSPDQRSIIEGAFEVAERTLREIVVPRGSVVSVPAGDAAADALQQLIEAGHSRAPVHKGDLDDVLGIIHVRDLINHHEGAAEDHTRPATVLPESLGVLDALRRLQGVHQQMAIVVNEHGGVEGIITVEDLLEEIVGEIYDEFDRDVADVAAAADGSITLPGSFPIHDLGDVGVEFPERDSNYATIAGYVLEQLGRIPDAGDVAVGPEWNPDWSVEVLEVDDRAITKVRIVHTPEDDET